MALAAAMLLAMSASAFAQSDPAGLLARETQRAADELAANRSSGGKAVVAGETVRAELPPPGGPTVLLVSVVFEPRSAFLSDEELDAITQRYVGRHLDFSAISNLVRDVNDLYAEKGVVTAAALLPPQELSSGALKVQLVEGRVGVVTVVGEHRTSNDLVFDAVRLTRDGDIVDVPTAASDIVRFNKTHHAQLGLLLQPGAAFGLTDLVLGISEPPPNSMQFFLNNEGVVSTGVVQAGASYRGYGMFGVDDNLVLYGSGSLGSIAGTANFDMPISSIGTRIALGVTGSSIRVIDGPTEPLDITGHSAAVTATLTQSLITKPDLAVIALLTGSYGISDSFSGDVPLVDTATTKAAAGVSVSYANETLSISAQPQLILALADNRLFDTRQGFVIAAGTADASVQLADDVQLVTRGAWQYTAPYAGLEGMPGGLLFQIGGPGTVRGYPSSGVGGDSGYYVQTELHWAPPSAEGLDLFVLADFGEVFSTFPARTTLASVGAGLNYAWQNGVNLGVTAGVPILDAMSDQSAFALYGRVTGSLF